MNCPYVRRGSCIRRSMSIVNEALKKAAKAKDKKNNQKISRQDPWILSVTTLNWNKPLWYGGAALFFAILAVVSWWALQNLSDKQEMTVAHSPDRTVLSISPGKILTAQPETTKPQPSKVAEHYQKGLAYYRENRLNEAEQEFLAVISEDPNHAAARNNLGLIYYTQGRDQEALREYLEALKINPAFPEAMNNLGLVYDQQGHTERAASLYQRALTLKPDYSEAHLNYAIILDRLGYLEEARRHYQKFLSDAPRDLEGLVASVQARLPSLR